MCSNMLCQTPMHAQLDKYSVHSAEAVKQRKLMRQQALLPELSYVLQESQVALAAEHHSRTSSGHKSLKSSESWTGDEQPLAIEPLTETAREELVFEELLREYSDMVDKQLESTFSKMQDFVPHPAPIFPEVISMEALDALLERLERNATDEPQTHLEAESDTLESERMKHHESESVTESVAESVSSTKSKKPKKKTTKKKRSKPIQKPVTATGRFMIYSSQEHEDNFTTILYKIIDSYGYNLLHLHKRFSS
ncbi:hypothetical protein EDD86DRAFT_263227 [Gorgonomyces haynaldii]|nr:hypothetical protein EDD86DRAFT_263227 [Gorgonomyces haynaldii]